MKKQSTLLFFLLIFQSALNISCNEDVCSIIFKADMICEKISIAIPSVETGTAFAISTLIKNVAETAGGCGAENTASTPNTLTAFNSNYRSDQDQPWQPGQIYDADGNLIGGSFNVGTEPLAGDEVADMEPGFRMQEPGQYMFAANADGMDNADESNESNNGGESGTGDLNGRLAHPSNVVIVTVVAGPDYVPGNLKEGEVPSFEYLGTKVTYHRK